MNHSVYDTQTKNSADGINRENIEPDTIERGKKKRDPSTLRKAPQAPKRFKSSYIMFFMAKQQEIKATLGAGASVGDVSKESSNRWKKLKPEERVIWDQKAKEDKERYNAEKAAYTGPWQVPWKRAKKDPTAPKRPMSAFLFFSQDKRRMIKNKNPEMRNTEISRVLGEIWKKASDEERAPHIEREATERAKYKLDIAKWRKEESLRKEETKQVEMEQAKFTAQKQSKYPYPPSSAPSMDNQFFYDPQAHGLQRMHPQQFYSGSYEYYQPPPQGYEQASQYNSYEYPSQQGHGYYGYPPPDTNSMYPPASEDMKQSIPSSSTYPISNSGSSQYSSHPHHAPPQSSGHYDGGYQSYTPHQSQGDQFHPDAVNSYEADFDPYARN